MALKVGEIVFNVKANTAEFESGLGKVPKAIDKLATASPDSFWGKGKKRLDEMGITYLAAEFDKARLAQSRLAAMKPWSPVVQGWAEKYAIDVNRAKSLTQGMGSGGGSLLMAGFAGGVGGSVAGMMERLAGTIISVGRSTVTMAANMETARASFEVLTGSGRQAHQMLEGLRSLSSKSGMDFGAMQDGAKTLMQFGVESDRVIPILRTIGEITGGNADRTQMMTLAFAQMSAAGRMMGQDLLQMINAGFNPLQQISKKTGESMIDLKKRMEEGGISAIEVMQAFQDATEKGGRFFGMAEKQAGTFNRQWAQFKSQLSTLGTELGQHLLIPLTEGLRLTNSLIKSFNSWRGAASAVGDETKKIVTKLDEIEASEKKRADQSEKQVKAMDDANKKMKDRAANIARELQTPLDKAIEKYAELQELSSKGLLDPETTKKAMDNLLDDLEKATDLKQRLSSPIPDIGLADMRTSEGSRMASQFNANLSKVENAVTAQLEADKRREALLAKILEAIKKKPPVKVNEVRV